MSAAPKLPYGGKDPKPTPAMKRFLVHMQECSGGWTDDDPVRIDSRTINAAERLGWAKVERYTNGLPSCATITKLGVAAYRWGQADVFTAD